MYWQVSGSYQLISHTDLSFSRYGYVIAVTSIDNIGVGKIQPGKNNRC
jgi:hypothetical protein